MVFARVGEVVPACAGRVQAARPVACLVGRCARPAGGHARQPCHEQHLLRVDTAAQPVAVGACPGVEQLVDVGWVAETAGEDDELGRVPFARGERRCRWAEATRAWSHRRRCWRSIAWHARPAVLHSRLAAASRGVDAVAVSTVRAWHHTWRETP